MHCLRPGSHRRRKVGPVEAGRIRQALRSPRDSHKAVRLCRVNGGSSSRAARQRPETGMSCIAVVSAVEIGTRALLASF